MNFQYLCYVIRPHYEAEDLIEMIEEILLFYKVQWLLISTAPKGEAEHLQSNT